MVERVAFLGLGAMGYPMASWLLRAGFDVVVWNRTRARAEAFTAEHGGTIADSPAEAGRWAAAVIMCLGTDEHVRQVALGPEGALAAMPRGAVLVDHTTASGELARSLWTSARDTGVGFLDAPVSGGEEGAKAGRLTIMIGGTEEDHERAEHFMGAYGSTMRHIGPAGSGQLAKMVNQVCIAGVLQGLSEGLHFAAAAGLDPRAVVEVISKGAAQSWQMDHRAQAMIDRRFDHGFAVDWMRKDLGLALNEARRHGVSLPLAALVDQLYAEVQQLGGGRLDTSSLIERLRAFQAGDPRPS